MFHVKHFFLCDLARRRKRFFTSRFTGNRTVENCGSGWPKRRNHRQNGRWQGVPRAGNVSREHGKISLSEAALGRSGARSVHAGAAGEKDCPEKDADQSISSRLEENVSRGTLRNFMVPAQEDRIRRGPLLAAGRGSPFWRRRHSRREMALEPDRRPFW